MRVLLFSDVHGDITLMKQIIAFHDDIDYRISLGDSQCPLSVLQDLNVIAIKGNYPMDAGFTYETTLSINDHKLLLVHGHRHNVAHSLNQLKKIAKKKQCDIALFGHSHIPLLKKEDGILFINPGSISKQRINITGTYVILTITTNDITVQFYQATTHAKMDEIQ